MKDEVLKKLDDDEMPNKIAGDGLDPETRKKLEETKRKLDGIKDKDIEELESDELDEATKDKLRM